MALIKKLVKEHRTKWLYYDCKSLDDMLKRLEGEIISIEEVSYRPLWEFGGLGWRIGRARKNGKWRIGYVMWLQKGIEIEATNGKYYVFGTNNPEEILSLLK